MQYRAGHRRLDQRLSETDPASRSNSIWCLSVSWFGQIQRIASHKVGMARKSAILVKLGNSVRTMSIRFKSFRLVLLALEMDCRHCCLILQLCYPVPKVILCIPRSGASGSLKRLRCWPPPIRASQAQCVTRIYGLACYLQFSLGR